jgi:hypothetical protein
LGIFDVQSDDIQSADLQSVNVQTANHKMKKTLVTIIEAHIIMKERTQQASDVSPCGTGVSAAEEDTVTLPGLSHQNPHQREQHQQHRHQFWRQPSPTWQRINDRQKCDDILGVSHSSSTISTAKCGFLP